jgi:hypothetical protein
VKKFKFDLPGVGYLVTEGDTLEAAHQKMEALLSTAVPIEELQELPEAADVAAKDQEEVQG